MRKVKETEEKTGKKMKVILIWFYNYIKMFSIALGLGNLLLKNEKKPE